MPLIQVLVVIKYKKNMTMVFAKEFLNGALRFITLLLCVIGVLGGIGYAIYDGVYHIAVGIAVCGWMAFPKAKEMANEITN